jgi:energy-coupling factor transporter transmembrane protein EcfT
MNISYNFTQDDLTAFLRYHNNNSPTVRKRRFWSNTFGFIACLIFPALIARLGDKPFLESVKDIWPLFLSPILFLLFVFPLSKFQTRRFYKKYLKEGDSSGIFGEWSFSSEDDGIHVTNPQSQSILFWSSFNQFIMIPEHLFLYTSGITALVIPRRAFESEKDLDNFVQLFSDKTDVSVTRV